MAAVFSSASRTQAATIHGAVLEHGRTLGSVDGKLDRLETMDGKLDRLETMDGKLDRLETMDGKLDDLDRIQASLDQQTGVLGKQLSVLTDLRDRL